MKRYETYTIVACIDSDLEAVVDVGVHLGDAGDLWGSTLDEDNPLWGWLLEAGHILPWGAPMAGPDTVGVD